MFNVLQNCYTSNTTLYTHEYLFKFTRLITIYFNNIISKYKYIRRILLFIFFFFRYFVFIFREP